MKALFLFQYNIPAELVIANQPDKFVSVKVSENGSGIYVEFLDLTTGLVTSVISWIKVWADVQALAEAKAKEFKNNALPILSKELNHESELYKLNS